MTTISFPSHLVGSVLLIASKTSCASLLTVLLTLLAFSCARASAAFARAWSALVESGARGAGACGVVERRVKVDSAARGRTWYVGFGGAVERARRFVSGQTANRLPSMVGSAGIEVWRRILWEKGG